VLRIYADTLNVFNAIHPVVLGTIYFIILDCNKINKVYDTFKFFTIMGIRFLQLSDKHVYSLCCSSRVKQIYIVL